MHIGSESNNRSRNQTFNNSLFNTDVNYNEKSYVDDYHENEDEFKSNTMAINSDGQVTDNGSNLDIWNTDYGSNPDIRDTDYSTDKPGYAGNKDDNITSKSFSPPMVNNEFAGDVCNSDKDLNKSDKDVDKSIDLGLSDCFLTGVSTG
jgi:hypothetical protein